MSRMIFVSIIVVGLLSSISFGYCGSGTGTPSNPYQICSAGDLLAMAADTGNYDKCFILMADIDLGEHDFNTAVIAHDIDPTNYNIFDGNAFTGTFDGNNHKISNLTINSISGNPFFIGLFGCIGSNGRVKNLGIEKYDDANGSFYLGGLAGENDGNICNCYATGSVNNDSYHFSWIVGGLVGYNHNGNISNCYATDMGGFWNRVGNVGGLVGHSDGGSISNCHATISVIALGDVGGLIADNDSSSITYCYSAGNVSNGPGVAGGLVGYNDSGSINNCSSTCDVTCGKNGAGGLVGGNGSGSINNCYSTGAVIGNTEDTGGLVGSNYSGSISNCYSTSPISGSIEWTGGLVGWNGSGNISNCYSTSTISGYGCWCVGGLVGGNESGDISNCYSTGLVSGFPDSNYIGGLVGKNDGSISDCYSTGVVDANDSNNLGGLVGFNSGGISNCYSTGDVGVPNDSNVGGLVGYNSGGISDCYSTGKVSGSCPVGGLVGYKTDGISNCDSTGVSVVGSFWDINTSGQTTSAGGEGKTTAQMQNIDTFLNAGWDFIHYWKMNGYPILLVRRGSVFTGLIDDFDSYSDTNSMLNKWKTSYGACEGYDGGAVLSLVDDGAERRMRYTYRNAGEADMRFSEARYECGPNGVDWTGGNLPAAQRPIALALSYERELGQGSNSADPTYNRMYVAIEDTAGNFNMLLNPDPSAQTHPCWQDWKIPLADLNHPGTPADVNLKAVRYFYIGFGERCLWSVPPDINVGDGNVMFDNIRLEQCGLSADFTGDCSVNFNDFAVMGEEWHNCGGQADLNNDCIVDLMDLAILADEWLK